MILSMLLLKKWTIILIKSERFNQDSNVKDSNNFEMNDSNISEVDEMVQ